MSGSIIGDHSIEVVDVNSSGKCIAANNQLKITSLKLVQHLAEKVFTCCKMARWTGCFRHKTNLSSLFDQAVQFTGGMAKISEQQGKPKTIDNLMKRSVFDSAFNFEPVHTLSAVCEDQDSLKL